MDIHLKIIPIYCKNWLFKITDSEKLELLEINPAL
jgi:hypothetical protein